MRLPWSKKEKEKKPFRGSVSDILQGLGNILQMNKLNI